MSSALGIRLAPPCILALVAASLAAPRAALAQEENPWRSAGRDAVARARALDSGSAKQAKNIILFVGDGMGVTTVTAARIYQGPKAGRDGVSNKLAFETFPYAAFSRTYSHRIPR